VLAHAGEEIAGQRIDDPPLRGIGVLRLVDEDMIETAIELVADPVGELRSPSSSAARRILVVEIDEPRAAWPRPRPARKPRPSRQRRDEPIGSANRLAIGARRRRCIRAHPRHAAIARIDLFAAMPPNAGVPLRKEHGVERSSVWARCSGVR